MGRSFSASPNRPGASGARAVLLCLMYLGAAWAPWSCTPKGGPAVGPEPSAPIFPALAPDTEAKADPDRMADLLSAAADSLEAGSPGAALEEAETVIRDHAGLPGSSRALEIAARAHLALGRFTEAARTAGELASLLEPAHPHLPSTILLAGKALHRAGEGEDAVRALLSLPPRSPDSILAPAREIVREGVEDLGPRTLEELVGTAPSAGPLKGIAATRLAEALYLRGRVEEAARWAGEALEGNLQERERRRAEAILDGTLEEVLGLPLVLGAVLPRTGASPNLLEYTRWIDEGIEVALGRMGGELRRPVRLEAVDTPGDSVDARASLRSLRSLGALGAIGPLTEEALAEAMEAREGVFPLISPFASLPPGQDAPGVYSLSGPNPGAARLVARYARDLGLDRVAVLRPGTDEARVDTEIFLREFLDLGGSVPREIVYEPGTTFFEPQFQEVEATLPDGLFLPLSPEDIELLAPQFTFYGMDTLGIQILGTSGWTEEEVVRGVETRHTDGVIAATTRPTQEETEARRVFRRAYEEHFRKTLRSDVPAFGHDAAALFLRALQESPRTSGQLLTALRNVRDFPGATGNLTVEEEWIVREAHLVRLLDRELIYISRRFD